MQYTHTEDGGGRSYWHNRTTGESTWDDPFAGDGGGTAEALELRKGDRVGIYGLEAAQYNYKFATVKSPRGIDAGCHAVILDDGGNTLAVRRENLAFMDFLHGASIDKLQLLLDAARARKRRADEESAAAAWEILKLEHMLRMGGSTKNTKASSKPARVPTRKLTRKESAEKGRAAIMAALDSPKPRNVF